MSEAYLYGQNESGVKVEIGNYTAVGSNSDVEISLGWQPDCIYFSYFSNETINIWWFYNGANTMTTSDSQGFNNNDQIARLTPNGFLVHSSGRYNTGFQVNFIAVNFS